MAVEDGIDPSAYGGDDAFANDGAEHAGRPAQLDRGRHDRAAAGRTPSYPDPDFIVSLTTPNTDHRPDLCGYQIHFEASCWQPAAHRVVINLARWVRGALAFDGDLGLYRQYAINHEVGHVFGNHHVGCGANGGLAPVMMQQTFGVSDDYVHDLNQADPANRDRCPGTARCAGPTRGPTRRARPVRRAARPADPVHMLGEWKTGAAVRVGCYGDVEIKQFGGAMPLPPLVEPAAELTKEEVARYSRHLIIPDVGMDGQKRLKNAKVLVVGAGGLGSPALLYLAAAGVGTLGIVEFDVVDESNLQRQIIHGQSDVGRPKAESARDSIAEINPFVKVNLHQTHLTSENALDIFRDYDLILDGTDNFATRYLVNDAAVLLGKPYVWGSIFRFEGQVSVFWEEHGPQYRDLYPEPPPPGMVPSCAEGGVLGVLCASIGSIMVTEAIKLITGIGETLLGRLMVYDALEMTYRTIKIRKDPNGEKITELIDYDAFCGVVSEDAQGRGRRPHHHAAGAQAEDRRARGLPAGGRARAARVRDRQDPGLGADPQGPDPVRRGAGRTAAGQADRAALQVRRPVGRGAGGAAPGRFRDAVHVGGGVLAWAREVDPSLPTY